MTFLPIVERELRVAARRWGTYWARLSMALVATCLGAGIITVTSSALLTPVQTGRALFQGLAGLLGVYGLVYGRRATADCLSSEKREGTLGLLFLTDLKGYDIVLGKLAATSVSGLYALLAVLPVLSICLLLGGTTSGEFWRMVLVLLNTFFLSLAVGMLGSALTRDFRRAMGANFMLLLLFVVALPGAYLGLAILLGYDKSPPPFLVSPLWAFPMSFDAAYRMYPGTFWQSVAGIHLEAWLLILLASRLVPRSRQEKVIHAKRARWRELWHTWNYGKAETRPAFRKRLLDSNAFYWLAARAQRKPLHVWLLLAAVALYWTCERIFQGQLWSDDASFVVVAVLFNFALKTWIAIEAGYELADDQKSGAVELLLSVPLTARDIVTGQVLALRRQFLKPCLAAIGTTLVLMFLLFRQSRKPEVLVIWSVAIVMFVLDVAALAGLSMYRGLTAKNHNVAIIGTLLRLLILPWAVFGLIIAVCRFLIGFAAPMEWVPVWPFCLGLWFGLGVAADLIFGLTAWRQLLMRFRPLALQRFDPPRKGVSLRFERKAARAGAWGAPPVPSPATAPSTKPSRKRPSKLCAALAALAALLMVGTWIRQKSRPTYPPPLVVPVMAGQKTVQVFPVSGGAFFILPDRSLWRWGQTDGGASPWAQVPEQIGTNCDWARAASYGSHCTGLRADGSAWKWGSGTGLSGEPKPAALGGNWKKLAPTPFGVALLRQDGKLWYWSYANSIPYSSFPYMRRYAPRANAPVSATPNLAPPAPPADPPAPAPTNLVQMGSDRDWADVCWSGVGTLGVKQDGTLWTWGRAAAVQTGVSASPRRGGQTQSMAWPGTVTYSGSNFNPSRVVLGTNWASLTEGLGLMAWTRSGELWDFSPLPGFSGSPANLSGRLVLSNSAPGRAVVAIADSPKLFVLRAGGSLWAADYSNAPGSAPTKGKWRRIGKRSDWVSIWSNGATAFGLTLDGTLWTWGADLSRPPTPTFALRMRAIKWGLQGLAGTRRPGQFSFQPPPAYIEDPRPLLRLVLTNSPG
jgi:ABC-type Na+ efflux pump permease subunit